MKRRNKKRYEPLYVEDLLSDFPEKDPWKAEIILSMKHPYRWQHTPRIKEMERLERFETFKARLFGKRSFKWTREELFSMMCVEGERNRINSTYKGYLYWLALRLKFCNEEVDELVSNYLRCKLNYDYSITGKETPFETMKRYGATYCEAIYNQYVEKTGFRPTKIIGHWIGNIPFYDRPFWHMNLNDTHTDVVLYNPHLDDYESGLTEAEKEELLEKIFKKTDDARKADVKNEDT